MSRCKVDRGQVTSQGIHSFIAGTGAVAVYSITNLSWEQEHLPPGRNCKKCDKQMNFIVRVMLRHFFCHVMNLSLITNLSTKVNK